MKSTARLAPLTTVAGLLAVLVVRSVQESRRAGAVGSVASLSADG